MKKVLVKDIKDRFNLIQLAGGKEALNRPVVVPELNRPGFELSGFYEQTDLRRTLILGDKEMSFIHLLDDAELERRFDFLMSDQTPVIIIARGYDCPEVIRRLAKERSFPVLGTALPTGRIFIDLIGFLDSALADSTVMHGVFLSIYGKGVLIKGESGIGKSEIALELIKKGHLFIVDDNIELYRVRQHVFGQSPKLIKNMLEIRGVGVIDVLRMFGVSTVIDRSNVDFVIELEQWRSGKEYDRLGVDTDQVYEVILGIKVPKIIVPVSGGRNISAIIEAAVMNLRLKENGIDSSKDFVDRIYNSFKEGGNQS